MTDDQIFQKKQECGQYMENINNFLKSKYSNADWVYIKYDILSGFYSAKLNSCVYSYKAFDRLCWINAWCPSATDYDSYVDFGIYDVLSNKEIYYKRTDAWQEVLVSESEFNTQIKELKGE